MLVLAGLLLGVLSRIEEVTDGFSLGISSDAAWLTTAAVAGIARPSAPRGAAAGAAVLTAANLGYYAWVLLTEPGTELASVAGPPLTWFALGIAGGAVFGAAGSTWATGPPAARVGASLLLAGVLIAEGIEEPSLGLAAGLLLPVLSARTTALRVTAAAATAVIVALAHAGALRPLLP